ncbi:hypothetical protein ILYODFUR_032096, partial [Ilyodon furcidens]
MCILLFLERFLLSLSQISVKEHLKQLTDAHKDFGLSQGSVESPFEQGISPNNVPYYI